MGSKIANGQNISKNLLHFLFGTKLIGYLKRTRVHDWLNNLPFEQINDCCPIDLSKLYSKLLSTSKPNFLHKELASLGEAKLISALITTNYDCGVELCLSKSSNINSFHDPKEFDPIKIPLFKIHGTSEFPGSIVYKLSQESKLPPNKDSLLKKLIKNRHLIVIGYSGMDFEICPSIIKGKPAKVTWYVRRGEKETPGYVLVKTHIDNTKRIDCDLSKGFPWSRSSEALVISKSLEFEILKLLNQYVNNKHDKLLWSLKLSNRIGYPKLSNKLLVSSSKFCKEPFFLEEKSIVDFNAGKYLVSERGYKYLYKFYHRKGNYTHALEFIIYGKTETLWCRGRFFKGIIFLLFTYYLHRRRFPKDNAIKLVIYMRLSRFLLFFKDIFPNFIRLIKLYIINPILKNLEEYYKKTEDVLGKNAAADYLLEFKENRTNKIGYAHLGNLINYSRSFRRELSVVQDITLLENNYQIMKETGCYPEVWKNALMLKILDKNKKKYWKKRKKKYQSFCQYTWIGKAFNEFAIKKWCKNLLRTI